MKKTFKILSLLLIILFVNCSKKEENNCSSIDSLLVSQNQEFLKFSINTNNSYVFYEISYQASISNPPENGLIFQITNKEFTKTIGELAIVMQNEYAFYVRGFCNQNDRSEWYGPVYLKINEFCRKPYDVNVIPVFAGNTRLEWSHFNNLSTYQVQYGIQGFTLGDGQIINSNTNQISNISLYGNLTYDFYVRAYCNNTVGWSNWTDPISYFSPSTQNMCITPSNLMFNNEGNNMYRATWSDNGENLFEYSITNNSFDPITNIQTIGAGSFPVFYIGTGSSKYFRVRAVCSNGNRTNWRAAHVP